MFRTPAKTTKDVEQVSKMTRAGASDAAGPSSNTNVRRSVGEWESGKSDRLSLTPPNKIITVGPQKPRPKPTAVRRLSVEASMSPPKQPVKPDRVAEAKACIIRLKTNLSNSRNLKTEIKAAILESADRLYQLVKEAELDSPAETASAKGPAARPQNSAGARKEESAFASSSPDSCLEKTMQKHMEMMRETIERTRTLNETLSSQTAAGVHDDAQANNIGKLLGEVRELRQTTEATERRVSSLQDAVPSYAEVLARPTGAVSPTKLRPKHSIIVSSEDDRLTSEDILGTVREALDAKTSGLQVTRVQKVKNQKVVFSCASREETKKVSEKITARCKNLIIEEAKNKDPLVIIRNILSCHKDEEVVTSLRSQNAGLLRDLEKDDVRAVVKYRRRARNPHENHVVLQVSPKLWQRLTEAKRVHVDLQYAVVQDQSPLVQCTRCLGYGHGRRLCTESVDLCSHCAGPHLRADCPTHGTGGTATCRNCRLAKYSDVSHNAFDGECPVRQRWDAIARSSVAYC